jgi:hypothetical protein
LVFPATGVFEGTFDISFTVSFENPLYTSTAIQIVPIKLLHPCKITTVSLLNIPAQIDYFFGDATKVVPFNLLDSVNESFGWPICTYSVTMIPDGSSQGVTFEKLDEKTYWIFIQTNDLVNKGTSPFFVISAQENDQKGTASTSVSFSVNIIDICASTSVQIGGFRDMSSYIKAAADT